MHFFFRLNYSVIYKTKPDYNYMHAVWKIQLPERMAACNSHLQPFVVKKRGEPVHSHTGVMVNKRNSPAQGRTETAICSKKRGRTCSFPHRGDGKQKKLSRAGEDRKIDTVAIQTLLKLTIYCSVGILLQWHIDTKTIWHEDMSEKFGHMDITRKRNKQNPFWATWLETLQ